MVAKPWASSVTLPRMAFWYSFCWTSSGEAPCSKQPHCEPVRDNMRSCNLPTALLGLLTLLPRAVEQECLGLCLCCSDHVMHVTV